MKFKAGDKVKVISLVDTEERYTLDLYGYMETCLNKVFTVKYTEGNVKVCFEENCYWWSKYDLALFNNTILEIE
jgi:hypothetical protein